MGLFGGTRVETTWRNLVRNVIAWIVVVTELDSNRIKVTVLENQKSREVRRIRRRVSLFIYTML